MKKLLLILFIFGTGAMLFAAGGQETAAPAEDEPIVLEYWMWDPNFAEQEQAMIDRYEADHPNVKINLTALDPKSYWTKLVPWPRQKICPMYLICIPIR